MTKQLKPEIIKYVCQFTLTTPVQTNFLGGGVPNKGGELTSIRKFSFTFTEVSRSNFSTCKNPNIIFG